MKNNNIGYLIELILLASTIANFFSSIMWTITGDTHDKWFSRFFLAIVSLGFYGVLRQMRKKEKI